ncbi:MAG: type I-E CRISPR-associated protein Cse1/CasA [Hyphomicrobiales bacterium]|nr:type I-E CRISPR-associated protein Cse1/CasA [Hyphomicrobiales bacterium]
MRFNFLNEPILSVKFADSVMRLSLPALLAAAMRDEIRDLLAVRPHQRQPLHAFLAQLGALALVAAERSDAPVEEAQWATLLRGLTPAWPDDAPWTLVVEDLRKPALLQPPIPEGRIDVLKESEATPDGLDMLVTSKNHDLKAARMTQATPEHWFLALLTLQTMEGFLGAGNYGIARMNGGFASRAMVGAAPAGGLGARLRRDILALAADHDANAAQFAYPAKGGKALLWLEPWDGAAQLQLGKLDPYFIEICRRVRLVAESGRLSARRAGSAKARIAADKTLNGKTGDPWAPYEATKVLTVDGGGFNYRRVAKLLDPCAFSAAPLQKVRREDGARGVTLHFLATARGQGGTDGFHERRIPVPPVAARLLGGGSDALAKAAAEQVEEAGQVRRGALNLALLVLFQNAPDKINFRHVASDAKAAPFLAAFDHAVDRIFFDALFERVEAADDDGRETARRAWLSQLRTLARQQLDASEFATPRSGVRRQFAIAAARDALAAAFFKAFPSMKEAADAGA